MSLESRIRRAPRPFEPEHAADLAEALGWAGPNLREVVGGAAGCSPYLRGLLRREVGWLEQVAEDPEAGLADLTAGFEDLPLAQLGPSLRQAKRRAALLVALADLGGVFELEAVTGALTDLADRACALAFDAALAEQVRRRRLPPFDSAAAAGIAVFAMGKMGAGELNYSSDIDLICLFDESRHDPADFADLRAGFVRATRAAAALLNDVTAEGYIFRTDLRLRPDPAVTPVCLAMEAAERYYESLGRTWERAAWIKARPCAGDLAAGEAFLTRLRPFIWRRHLDFAAIEDAHNMRLAIRSHKGTGGPLTLERHNMKLGRGGIREIEFFTQTRQLIAGGRDQGLRQRETRVALAALSDKGWVPGDVARTLSERYVQHREVEHRLQMIHDAQTHDLPGSAEGFDRLAAFMGTDTAGLRRQLEARLVEVHSLTEPFFAPGAAPATSAEDDDTDLTRRWLSYPALRSSRAVEIFKRLRPELLRRLNQAARPDEAIKAFDGFLQGLPAGVQVFSLFEANPQLVDLVIDIIAVSPDLATYLSRNAGVLDAVLGGDFFSDWPGRGGLEASLGAVIAREADYEARLDAARRWGKEWHFRVGVHLLRGLTLPEEARVQYAHVAEAAVAALWPEVQANFARRHGPPPGRGAVVLGMGSLGTGALHSRSDLDVIVIYDADGVEASDGPRPLAARPYYARLTQALITAISAPTAEGRLYELDMRLRPSGNQGPVATSLAAFRDYQKDKAWTWEHLALTRARVIAGPQDLARDVDAARAEVLATPRDRDAVLAEVATMRDRISAAKAPFGPLDPKIGPGRLQDIELMAQAGALLCQQGPRTAASGLEAGVDTGCLTRDDAKTLARAHEDWTRLQQGLRLIGDGSMQPADLGGSARAFLVRLFDLPDMEAVLDRLDTTGTRAARIINTALPAPKDTE